MTEALDRERFMSLQAVRDHAQRVAANAADGGGSLLAAWHPDRVVGCQCLLALESWRLTAAMADGALVSDACGDSRSG